MICLRISVEANQHSIDYGNVCGGPATNTVFGGRWVKLPYSGFSSIPLS